MKAHRVVVKVGSSSLTGDGGRISVTKMTALVRQVARLHQELNGQVVLVSSGAIAAGIGKLGWDRATCTMPEKQAAAAVGQQLLMSTYERLFAEEGIEIGQMLLTRSDIEDRKRFLHIRNTMTTLLHHGILPIVNENDTVAVDEIRFGDNDTLGSLVALVAEADQLILLTDIDGIYSSNPKHNPNAQKIEDVWTITDELERVAGSSESAVGTGGMRTKVAAAKIAVQSGIDVIVAASYTENVLLRVLNGERVGTMFHALPDHPSAKKSWIAFGSQAKGRVFIDAGAAKALSKQSGSLLMPGVIHVEGDFPEGAIVELIAPDGHVLGRGIVNFSARDLSLLLQRRQFGESVHPDSEVVHRNNMMVFPLQSNSARPSQKSM